MGSNRTLHLPIPFGLVLHGMTMIIQNRKSARTERKGKGYDSISEKRLEGWYDVRPHQ